MVVAIREAAKWYKIHLTASLRASKTTVPEIVLLTNDQGNLDRAKAVGVTAVSSSTSFMIDVNGSGGIY
jgi:hypothetical protein